MERRKIQISRVAHINFLMTRYTDSQPWSVASHLLGYASLGEDWTYRYDGFGRRYEKERFGSAHPGTHWRAAYLAEYMEIETWNGKTIQSGLDYLTDPGGR